MTPDPHARPRSLLDIFLTFSALALQGFGGVLAVAQRELVERKRWLSREAFLDAYSLAQLLPGPNVVNLSLMLGDRFFGLPGALAAIGGMIAAPLVIVLVLAAGYASYAEQPAVAGMLRGMGSVAAGLMFAMALRMAGGLRRNPMGLWVCATLGTLTLFAIVVLRLPLAWVVLGLGAVGCLIASVCLVRQVRP